jgi:DNA-binding PadR family transcriptional regulator
VTKAQRKALEWLLADGSWKTDPGRIAQAISSLSMNYRGYVEEQAGPFGQRGGYKWRYRLTPAGQKFRAETLDAGL